MDVRIDGGDLAGEIADLVSTRVSLKLNDALKGQAPNTDGWLNTDAAANYLGITTNALHKLAKVKPRKIAYSQEKDGGPLYFKISDLDAYRERGYREVAKIS